MPHARTTKTPSDDRHMPSIVLAAITCSMALAACGSSSISQTAGSNPASQGIAFADCMRTHGVPGFPDPSAGGGGIQIQAGINPQSPAFQSALRACGNLMPGPGSQHPSEQRKLQMLQISECMRRRGVSGFPDPTLRAPSSPAGYSLVEDRGGVILAIPVTINVDSPLFKAAAAVCSFAR